MEIGIKSFQQHQRFAMFGVRKEQELDQEVQPQTFQHNKACETTAACCEHAMLPKLALVVQFRKNVPSKYNSSMSRRD